MARRDSDDILGYRAMALRAYRVPAEDELLDYIECAALVFGRKSEGGKQVREGEHGKAKNPTAWYGYAIRFPALIEGFRPLRVKGPDAPGSRRWLKSSLIYHIRVELMHGPAVEIDSAEGKRLMAKKVRGAA